MSSNNEEKEPFYIRAARICMCKECVECVEAWEDGKIGFVIEAPASNCSAFGAEMLVRRLRDRAAMNRRNGNEERALAFETAILDVEELLS